MGIENIAKSSTRQGQGTRRKAWGIILLILAVLTVIKLIALPYGIGYGAKRWILANGGDASQSETSTSTLLTPPSPCMIWRSTGRTQAPC